MHLLDLADEAVLGRAGGRLEHRPELMERQPRPIILIATIHLHDAPMAHQVALLADRISERGLQLGGVDDRHVPAIDDGRDCDVELAGPVAALAADRVALEDRWPITVDRARHRLDPVRVAVQAEGQTGRWK